MTLLRSGTRIHSDLRIIAFVLWIAHYGRPASLIHVTKETAALLLDHKLLGDTFLVRRFTIHGVEAGIKPNDIFRKFIPLGKALVKYAEGFGLFRTWEKTHGTILIPLTNSPPDLSGLVADPRVLAEEAKLLGSLGLVGKNVLATHRNLDMTRESHRMVARLFLRYNNALLGLLESEKPKRTTPLIKTLVDRMNECVDELVKKSTFYPIQATIVKHKLSMRKRAVATSFAERIHPHEEFSTQAAPVSEAIMRGSHLVRSLLRRKNLYPLKSTPVKVQTRRFIEACRLAELNLDTVISSLSDEKAIMRFLRDTLNSRLMWWV